MRAQFLITTALIAVVSVGPLTITSAHAGDQMTQSGTSGAEKFSYDAQFLDTMAEHHRGGIEMMELAAGRALSPEIKEMAAKGIKDQGMEIEELKGLRKEVGGDDHESAEKKLPGVMSEKQMDSDMATLESLKGEAFDGTFLKSMIKHHEGAVKMSDDASAKAKNTEVKKKAQEIHDKQKVEISEMQAMLKEME